MILIKHVAQGKPNIFVFTDISNEQTFESSCFGTYL